MWKWTVLIFMAHSATAAEPKPACFEIVNSTEFPRTLLLDKCSGLAWGLVQSQPDARGMFNYSWNPIPIEKAPISLLSESALQAADDAAVAGKLAEQNRRFAAEREANSQERIRLRGVLGREPTPLEVSHCVAKEPECPSPP